MVYTFSSICTSSNFIYIYILVNFQEEKQNNENDEAEHEEHDPYFEPIIVLPEVHIYSMEEDEEDLVKL